MGILLCFAVTVVLQIVITNGVEPNPPVYSRLQTDDDELQSMCNKSRYDCAKVTSLRLDFSSPITFSHISIDNENRVALQWQDTANAGNNTIYFLKLTTDQGSSTCWLVDPNYYTGRTHKEGKNTYNFPCLTNVLPGSVYNLSVLTHDASSYLISLPQQTNNVSVPVLAVGEAVCSANASVHVLFERPASLITSAKPLVQCYDSEDNSVYDISLSMGENETVCEFIVPRGKVYKIKLEFEGCNTSCPEVVEQSINVPATCGIEGNSVTSPSSSSTPTLPPPTVLISNGVTKPSSTTPEPDGSVVQKPAPSIAESAKKTTIIAVVSAVLAALFISVAVGCIYRKKRQREDDGFILRRLENGDSDTSSLTTEKAAGAAKSSPSVLVLYSYDCAVHERVVIEFAAFLKHECGCDVALDIWEQETIKTRGAAKWLDEKLDFSDVIIVVGSAGARFKCQRKKQYRMKQTRPVPDMFVYGADQITEKVRFAKQYGNTPPQCIVVCFEYATTSDIPPKLDTMTTLSMMKALPGLHAQLYMQEDRDSPPSEPDINSATGRQLQDAIQDAMKYFKENSDWLGQCLEPITPVSNSNSNSIPSSIDNTISTTKNSDSNTVVPAAPPPPPPPSPPSSSSSPSRPRTASKEEAHMLVKRNHKRQQEEEVVLSKVPSSHHLSLDPWNPVVNGLPLSSLTSSNSTNNFTNHTPTLNTLVPPPNHHPLSTKPPSNPFNTAKGGEQALLEDDYYTDNEDDEMLQLQRDIDFINNYQYNENNPTDVLLQLDGLSSSYESSSFGTSPLYAFSNPLYSQNSGTKHMLQKNGLGRVSVGMSNNKKMSRPNHNNNSFVVDFNLLENDIELKQSDISTHL